jgi:hypothetical protein
MALTKVQAGIIEATGTPSASTFLRGDGTWSATPSAITSGTAVTASGTSVDFTPANGYVIPATTKRITVMFSGVSTNATSNLIIQIGTGGTPLTTSYLSACGFSSGANNTSVSASTTGFMVSNNAAAADIYHGTMLLNLLDTATNKWVYSSVVNRSDATVIYTGSGSNSLSGVLNMVRITTVGGTATFDAGSINIMWE